MSGTKGFNEVFFDNVRTPKKFLVGEKNNGWQVAITTLMFERGVGGGGQPLIAVIDELVSLAQRVNRDGRPAWSDASVRQRIAEFKCEAEALRFTNLRQLTRRLKGLPPGAEGSIMKLCASELNLRIELFAMELLGPWSQLEFMAPNAIDEGRWVVPDAERARRHDRGGHQPDSAQHHRRTRPGPAQGIADMAATVI